MIYSIRGKNIPSSKNGKMIVRGHLFNNPRVQEFYKYASEKISEFSDKFKEEISENSFPIFLHVKFYRDSKRRWDFINPLETIQDMLVKNKLIPDDSVEYLIPVYEKFEYDKNNPGVEFWIEKQ